MLKPKSAEVILIYSCPKCQCEWGKTPQEIIHTKGFYCDGCRSFIKCEPIRNVRVIPTYKSQPQKKAKEGLTQTQQAAIIELILRGFPRKEAEKFVKQHKFANITMYVQAAIRKGLE